MRFFIRSLQKRIGITTVYVTHDQAEAMVISDRIVVMAKGRIGQLGSAVDIYRRPASREVADFIGLANFIDGRIGRGNGEHPVLASALGGIHCSSAQSLAEGAPATVIVRPESIRLSNMPPVGDSEVNHVPGRILERFYLGYLAGYRVACGDGLALQVQEEPWHEFHVGDNVWCTFPGEQVWVLPQ